jgi:methylenetetrahydrofolate dehydrogenase (NADP+)/methenyltetrahydrofolate cyclohydrolase
VLVGENPASVSYVRGKEKACASIGMTSRHIGLAADISMEKLKETVRSLNEDDEVDGILVQFPLPNHLDQNEIIRTIDPNKDADGLHPVNVGKLYMGEDGFRPCTPLGIMVILKKMNCPIDGMHAVVVGRSQLVGQPVSKLLLDANATVTMCHSHTKNLKEIAASADILIAAVGKPEFFTKEYIKEGAYVIDVGINRTEDGHLVGDVDFEDVREKAGFITPVPKGVGPMTITMLLSNTIRAYEVKNAGL